MRKEPVLIIPIIFLLGLGHIVLRAIAPAVFPVYFAYLFVGIFSFLILSHTDFEILKAFSNYLYIVSIIFLILPLLIGQVTRGVVRWIPIGPLTIQPAEIVRPFLLIFFAQYLTSSPLDTKKLAKAALLAAIPLILILIQPSLGVSILTALGFLGIVLSSEVKKTTLAKFAIIGTLLAPLSWFFMAPYQKSRILSIISPTSDPQGTGYNSIQSMITVGSGKIFGRGLGQGVQTQLSFLPERHTDFIFASISEELGLVGSLLVVFAFTLILYQIIKIIENSKSIESRAFCAGVFLTLFAQVMIHLAMNMAIFPITGIPLPLVSAGGSSLIATLTTLGIVTNCKKG